MKFSIIVPVYNVAPYLDECLGSLAAQSFRDWEAICVDDGSTDASGGILDGWAERDSRFRVFHKKNGGVSSARNFALEKAEGEYLWFVDGDDAIAPNALATIDGAIKRFDNPDIVQFKFQEFETAAVFEQAKVPPAAYDLRRKRELRQAYRSHAGWLLGSTGVFRREIFGGERFAGFANGEDSLWGRRAFYRARRLVFLDAALYGYRQRVEGANKVWTEKRWREFCKVSWIMTREGLLVGGIRLAVLVDWLKSLKYAMAYRKRIVK